MNQMNIRECPRDAMQGLPYFIPTKVKEEYLLSLLEAGFSSIDIGSFVSSRTIPQLSDTAEVLSSLASAKKEQSFLVIVANESGALRAARHPAVDFLGFPWSISSAFLRHNIRSNKQKAFALIHRLLEICLENKKELLVYISMAYGNPYGESWSRQALLEGFGQLWEAGLRHISLSDTIGVSDPDDIYLSLNDIQQAFPESIPGFHLHTSEMMWHPRVEAAWEGGCRNFDSVLNALGGCPMTGYELVGNLNTLHLLSFCREKDITHSLDEEKVQMAASLGNKLLSSGLPLPPR